MKRDGFSLIEVMFVLMALSFGVLALLGAQTAALHQASTAGRHDARWAVEQRWSDSLTARGYGGVVAGGDTIGAVRGTWTVQAVATDLERVIVALEVDQSASVRRDTLVLHLYR